MKPRKLKPRRTKFKRGAKPKKTPVRNIFKIGNYAAFQQNVTGGLRKVYGKIIAHLPKNTKIGDLFYEYPHLNELDLRYVSLDTSFAERRAVIAYRDKTRRGNFYRARIIPYDRLTRACSEEYKLFWCLRGVSIRTTLPTPCSTYINENNEIRKMKKVLVGLTEGAHEALVEDAAASGRSKSKHATLLLEAHLGPLRVPGFKVTALVSACHKAGKDVKGVLEDLYGQLEEEVRKEI